MITSASCVKQRIFWLLDDFRCLMTIITCNLYKYICICKCCLEFRAMHLLPKSTQIFLAKPLLIEWFSWEYISIIGFGANLQVNIIFLPFPEPHHFYCFGKDELSWDNLRIRLPILSLIWLVTGHRSEHVLCLVWHNSLKHKSLAQFHNCLGLQPLNRTQNDRNDFTGFAASC